MTTTTDQRAAHVAAAADDIGRAATADDACAVVTRFTGDRELLRAAIGHDLAATTDPDICKKATSIRLAALRYIDRLAAPAWTDSGKPRPFPGGSAR